MRLGVLWIGAFLSGAAALLYETAWIRQGTLLLGSATWAVSTVLAVFFLGLALGAWVLGRIGLRLSHPIRTFATLELGLAALGTLSLVSLPWADRIYGHAYRQWPDQFYLLLLIRAALLAAVILPSAFLMGGTLPLLCRQLAQHQERLVRQVALVYGLNTLGAAAGCAAAGFVLFPAIGITRTILLAATLNVTIGIALRLIPFPPPAHARQAVQTFKGSAGRSALAIYALFALTGLVALGLEVVWIRFLALVLRNTVYTYTLTLTVVLSGLVAGSLLAGLLLNRAKPAAAFGWLQLLSALIVVFVMFLPADFWRGLNESLGIYALLLLPHAVCSGASFPLAARLATRHVAHISRHTGNLTAFNTLGGVAGSLAVGFWLLPQFGLAAAVTLLTFLSLAAAALAWFVLDPQPRRRLPRAVLLTAAALAWLAGPRLLGTRLPEDFLDDNGALVAVREGFSANLAVIRNQGVLQLESDRWWQGEDRQNHQSMAAHVPMLLHPNPRRVLVVGVGTGQAAARFLDYTTVTGLVGVDIEPALFDFIRPHFDSDWMNDPRVRLLSEDGRSVVRHGRETYDVISLEVGQIFRPGIAAFYTREFYADARRRLNPGGIVTQFVPLPFFDPEEFRGVVATFLDVFPQGVLWYNTAELLLLGWNDSQWSIPGGLTGILADNARVRRDLQFAYWGGPRQWLNQPDALLAGFLSGPADLRALAQGAPIYRDDLPVLEYATRSVTAHDQRLGEVLDLIERHLSPFPASFHTRALSGEAMAAFRRDNLGEIRAAHYVGAVYRERAARDYDRLADLLRRALEHCPQHAEAHRLLGDVLMGQGSLPDALRQFRTAVAIRPDDARAHHGLAVALVQLERPEESLQHFAAAVAGMPEDAEVRFNRAAALTQMARHREAMVELQRVVELDPDHAAAREFLDKLAAALSAPAP